MENYVIMVINDMW